MHADLQKMALCITFDMKRKVEILEVIIHIINRKFSEQFEQIDANVRDWIKVKERVQM